METPILKGLGHALRWLRDQQGRKQYQVADAAGITKGMLSSYETGRQRPSLDTLEKILDTLACDLNDLHNAIQIVNGNPEGMRRKDEPGAASTLGPPLLPSREAVRAILGRGELPPGEEEALAQMVDGFHQLLRYLHELLGSLRRTPGGPGGPGFPGGPGRPEAPEGPER